MRQPGIRLAAVAAVLLAGIGSAAAFDIPDGQSCGGLVCDLGLFGHKTEPKAEVVAPVAQTPPSSAPIATSDTARRVEAPRIAHVAKPRPVRTQVAKLAKSGDAKPVAVPARAVALPAALPPTGMAAAFADPAPAAAPQPGGMVVLANPYVSTKPQPIQFQSVDPNAGLQ